MPTPRNHAILVGIEHSMEGMLKSHEYIAADIQAMKNALEHLGYARADVHVFSGKLATKESVVSELEAILASLDFNPGSLFVFLAAPGFSVSGINFLGCRDTTLEDLEDSSINLDFLLRELCRAPFTQVQIYIDSGWNEGALAASNGLEGIEPLSRESLDQCLRDATNLDFFSASDFSDLSFSSRRLKHGIWTYHLVKALSGEEPELLEDGRFLKAWRLQAYLAEQVHRTLRETYTDRRKKQAPWHVARSSGSLPLANLSAAIAGRKNSWALLGATLKDFSFTSRARVRVKALSGFRQGLHHSPKWSNRQAEEFVSKIALGEIEKDLTRKFEDIRQNLAYRRRHIEIRLPGEGDAWIRTPDFQYTVSVGLDHDPNLVVITRELSEIHRPEILGEESMARTFDEAFDSVCLSLQGTIDIGELVDLAESQGFPIEYPLDCSSCTVRSSDGATVRIRVQSLVLEYSKAQPLQRLIRGLEQILRILPFSEASGTTRDVRS